MKNHVLNILSKILLSYLFVFFVFLPDIASAQTYQSSTIGSTTLQNTVADSVTKINDLSRSNDDLIKGKSKTSTLLDAGKMSSGMSSAIVSVHILGDVENPGIYKVNLTDRAYDILKLGVPKRSTTRIIQIRHEGESTRTYDLYLYEYFGNLSQNPYLKDNDVIFVPKINGAVRVEGPVNRPGIYELNGEKTLSDVVRVAGGLSSEGLSESYPVRVIRFDNDGKHNVLEVPLDSSSMQKFKIAKGDIFIFPDKINAGKQFDFSVEAIPGQNAVYPTSVPNVFVIGAVTAAGPYPYKSQFTIKDYLGFAGVTADANFRHVVVLHDGKKHSRKLNDNVYAGDVIMVKNKNLDQVLKYIGIASTLMSVTLSAIVLKDVLKNQ